MTPEAWPNEFLLDLDGLRATELRRKYRREGNSHRNMKSRCKAGEATFDPSWEDFRQFLRDMGPRPEGTSLDRLDTELRHYGPDLCRWATAQEQTENRPNTVWVRYGDEEITLADYSHRTGVNYQTAYSAYQRGDLMDRLADKQGPKSKWEHPNPKAAAAFDARFRAWRKRVQPPFLDLALPEVLYVAEVSGYLARADAELERLGFYELAPDAGEEHPVFKSEAYRTWLMAQQRRREAMAFIASEHPHLVDPLTVRGDRSLRYIAELPERAVRRRDEDR